jgi:hypothetical protein
MRNLRLLRWAGEQYGARMDHLQALTGTTKSNLRTVTGTLRRAGLLRTERIIMDQPPWVIPSLQGLRACNLPYQKWTPMLGRLVHVGAINDVRIHVEGRTPQADWISERQIRFEEAGVNVGHPDRRHKHLPDGVVLLDGRSMAIEVELTVKLNHRLESILNELTARFDAVMYFCAPVPYRQLTRFEQTGRWPTLGVRELPPLPMPTSKW